MAPPNIRMNPDGVRQVASDLRAGADTAKHTIGTLFHSGNQAAGAHADWKSGAALKECGHTWWKELTTLVEQTAHTAWKLDQSAEQVSNMDKQARERLGAVLGDLRTA
ncbi:hypothetical protein [Amycolatopsis albispora]|nr:hypothetical protein [Amycolatopsis albispora]